MRARRFMRGGSMTGISRVSKGAQPLAGAGQSPGLSFRLLSGGRGGAVEACRKEGVDTPDKPGHDGIFCG